MGCILRAWQLSDAKDLATALSNKNVLNNLRDGLPYPYMEKDAEDYIDAMLSADPEDTFVYAICIDDKAVCSIGAFRQSNIHARTVELGYYVAEEYWGYGVMTDAVRQLCDRIFDETDILRIFAEPFAYNTGSRRVLGKYIFTWRPTTTAAATCLHGNDIGSETAVPPANLISGGTSMKNKVRVVIDIQDGIAINYREIIGNINKAVDRAVGKKIHVVYIKHNNLSAGTRTLEVV